LLDPNVARPGRLTAGVRRQRLPRERDMTAKKPSGLPLSNCAHESLDLRAQDELLALRSAIDTYCWMSSSRAEHRALRELLHRHSWHLQSCSEVKAKRAAIAAGDQTFPRVGCDCGYAAALKTFGVDITLSDAVSKNLMEPFREQIWRQDYLLRGGQLSAWASEWERHRRSRRWRKALFAAGVVFYLLIIWYF